MFERVPGTGAPGGRAEEGGRKRADGHDDPALPRRGRAGSSCPCGPFQGKAAMVAGGSGQLDLDLDLHRRVQRQHRDAHRAAGVHALVPQDLAEQLARAVDHTGLPGEVGG